MWKYKIVMYIGGQTEIKFFEQGQIDALNELMSMCVRKDIKFKVMPLSS